MSQYRVMPAAVALASLVACAASTGSTPSSLAQAAAPDGASVAAATRACAGKATASTPGPALEKPSWIKLPSGFTVETIAQVGGARELVALPDGDLLVGTQGSQYYVVPDAESAGRAGTPEIFATIDDSDAEGVAFAADRCEVYFATQYGVWATPYKGGDLQAERVTRIAKVRTGGIPPGSDGDVHRSTSIAYSGGTLYVSVGSSCNACTEIDPTRASILTMHPDGTDVAKRATRIRNAIALTVDAATGAVWAGGAGQDDLPFGHPYEFLDDVTSHNGVADYGWPECEENHVAYTADAACGATVAPRLELPAYSTIIGDVFYPAGQSGKYAFPAPYRGGIFATTHGSWHTTSSGAYASAPLVAFFAMRGDEPAKPVDWSKPTTQWDRFAEGFQPGGRKRNGRPTGIAVGPKGSLFVADDANGVIYRIRPDGQ
jgi:glucose/arabinose dehydrogenase